MENKNTKNLIKVSLAIVLACVLGANASFAVNSGISGELSTISPSDQVVEAYEDASLTVALLDLNSVPVSGHKVKLIASDPESSIKYLSSNISDKDGKVRFLVTNGAEGVVTYTAYDQTADKIIDARAKVAYFSTAGLFGNAGNATSTVDSLKFEDALASVSVGEEMSLTVGAYDENNALVSDYDGTVSFSVIDGNESYVVLPDDYTFKVADQGQHTFSLAFIFNQPGEYELEVRDTDNSSVFGTQQFTVEESGTGVSNEDIFISNPISGSYSNNTQVISGKAKPGDKIKIFDNNVVLSTLTADVNGDFSYTTGVLEDGDHVIYAATVNEVGTIVSASDEVTITIDTAGPEGNKVEISPAEQVDPGTTIKVKFYSNDNLSQADLVLNNEPYSMTQNQSGYYEVDVVAPIEFGQYPLAFRIVDELGNDSTINSAATLTVGQVSAAKDGVGSVSGLKALPGENKVTLTWDALSSGVQVKNYRVYYGISPTKFTKAVDTFTNSNTWYVPNLDNNVEYFFAVTAIGADGSESAFFSNVVSASPKAGFTDPSVYYGSAGGEALQEMNKDVSETGPEMIWLLALSILAGYFYSQSKKKRLLLRDKIYRD